MPWLRLDDDFLDHPKLVALDAATLRTWLRVLAYTNRRTQRAYVTDAELAKLGVSTRARAALTTPAAGYLHPLWEPSQGGIVIHDRADYQPASAEDRAELSAKRAEVGRKGGVASGERRRAKSSEPLTTVKQLASPLLEAKRTPVPSRPVPEEEIPPVAPPGGEPERERPRDPFGDGCLGSAWVEELRLARGTPATSLAMGELRKLVQVVDAHGVDADRKPLPDREAWLRPQARAFALREGGQLTLTVWAFADWMDNEKRSRPRPGAVPVQAAPPAGQRGWTRRGPHARTTLDDDADRPAGDGSDGAGAGAPVRPVH